MRTSKTPRGRRFWPATPLAAPAPDLVTGGAPHADAIADVDPPAPPADRIAPTAQVTATAMAGPAASTRRTLIDRGGDPAASEPRATATLVPADQSRQFGQRIDGRRGGRRTTTIRVGSRGAWILVVRHDCTATGSTAP
jgi:hypothetical protein